MSLTEQKEFRARKVARLRELGVEPYPPRFARSNRAAGVLARTEALRPGAGEMSLAGRIRAVRDHGDTKFADLEDETGRIQLLLRLTSLGQRAFEVLELLEIGDWIGVNGPLVRTRAGEWSIDVQELTVLSKALRSLPEKYGLKDIETRYRQRYVDLAVNPSVREVFRTRSQIVQIVREVFDGIGGLEVETPALQPIYGGASARPFKTFHNSLGCEFYLRIANELYLKRLIVGGFDCVYEICKDFRNEGMSRQHNPEFTMVEIYWAFKDYWDMMGLTEELIVTIADRLNGTRALSYQGTEVDLTPPWTRVPMVELVERHTGIDASQLNRAQLYSEAQDWLQGRASQAGSESGEHGPELGAELDGGAWGEIVYALFEEAAEPELDQPVFVIDFPKEVSPLAKEHRNDPRLTERFELFIAGKELANAFSELNDPIDQRARLESEDAKREGGDEEAQTVDEDYLRALEYGMPPTGGLGIGIDRLTMLFTNQASIQDVILFPHMRPEVFESRTTLGTRDAPPRRETKSRGNGKAARRYVS